MNFFKVAPGDVIQYDPANVMDADVPLFVIACDISDDMTLHVLVLYMVEERFAPLLKELRIPGALASDYRWIIRAGANYPCGV